MYNSHCRNTTRKQFRFSDIMKKNFESVNQLPRKLLNLHIIWKCINKTVGKFVELPPFVTTVKDLVTKVTTLFKDIKNHESLFSKHYPFPHHVDI